MTPTPTDPDEEARTWARPFLRSLLDHWLAASADPSGLFHPALDRRWRRIGDGTRTLVSQCRLIYNFCRGYETFGDAAYAEAATGGLRALQTYFSLGGGRYRWAVSGDGSETSPTPDSYGHAFCLLAQATAARALGDSQWTAAALETWGSMQAAFRDDHGGLVWRDPNARSQNPVMHTFEALMALRDVDQGEGTRAAGETLAFMRGLADFAEGRLVERFTPDWRPMPDRDALDLGHQFEWALLLSDWHTATGDEEALQQGRRFLETGVEWGMDTDSGVWESCDREGRVQSRVRGLWQQCEAIRALRRYAHRHGQAEWDAPLARSLAFYRRHFVDAEYGGLLARPEGLGATASTDKGDLWKLDYHSVNLCLELIR